MYQRNSRRAGVAMVALSLCLRLCMLLGWDAKAAAFLSQAARQPDFARFLLYLATGQVVSAAEPTAEQQLYILQWEPAEEPENEPADEPEP